MKKLVIGTVAFLFLPVSALLALPPTVAIAHGGGTDGLGCHNDRKTGGYHCHSGPLAGQQFESKEQAQRALDKPKDKAVTPPAAPKK